MSVSPSFTEILPRTAESADAADSANSANSTITVQNGDEIISISKESLITYVGEIISECGCSGLSETKIVDLLFDRLKEVNTIQDIEDEIISVASELTSNHHDYPKVAMRLLIDRLHSITHSDYEKVVKTMNSLRNKKGDLKPLLSDNYYNFVMKYHKQITAAFHYERDYDVPLFGYRTLEKSYLKKTEDGVLLERPQHMFMRVAIAIHQDTHYGSSKRKLKKIFQTYELLSTGMFTHATPTYFNAGSTYQQLSSCFLLGLDDDMEGVGDCWKNTALISKYGGGIGIHCTALRCMGSHINSTGGKASGMTIATVFNEISRYANQGGRPGSFALYIEPWHGDIFYFLDLKKNTGAETDRARDLFLGLTINDIFMKRVEADEDWCLMCPSVCTELINKYGTEFEQIYLKYEAQGEYLKKVKARDLWWKILESQIETGVPYILFKDATNYKSNQKNIGVINGSNLCIEIVEVSTADEYAVCNLATICLPKYVEIDSDGKPSFNHQKLFKCAKVATRNLNNMIDVNYYPVEKARKSNLAHRPIGIGVQGLADVFFKFKIPFDSETARQLNKEIFETIYFGFLTMSNLLAEEYGKTYETYKGSPLSEGKFQFDLWGIMPSNRWDWEGLRKRGLIHGYLNSLGTAEPPTASTSQIMGNNETMEAMTSNVYVRSTMAGSYYVVNKFLMEDLMALGLWNEDMLDMIKIYDGSVQHIPSIPDHIKEIYRTVYEIPQSAIIQMAADRAPFIDQTQSMNIFMARNKFYPPEHWSNQIMNIRLSSSHFKAWKLGLKTGIYYLRTKTPSDANKFGVDIDKIKELEAKYKLAEIIHEEPDFEPEDTAPVNTQPEEAFVCRMEAGCLMCGS